MTDQEINEAVAKKLGYCTENHKSISCTKVLYLQNNPDYCHSIVAAWEIVNWIEEKCSSVNLIWDEEVGKWELSWISSGKRYTAIEQTIPMAMCLAFLKLP